MIHHAFLVVHSFCWAYTPFEIPYDPKCHAGNLYHKGQIVYVGEDEWTKYNRSYVYTRRESKNLSRKWKEQLLKNVKPFREIRIDE